MRKFSNSSLIFCFYYLFILYFLFYFYYIKINIFHKNKNVMNFYKLIIKNIIIIMTHPHPLLAAGVPATPQNSPAITSND